MPENHLPARLADFEALLDEEMQVLKSGTPEQLMALTDRKQALAHALSERPPADLTEVASLRCQHKNKRNGALLHLLAQRTRKDLHLLSGDSDQSYSRKGAAGLSVPSRIRLCS